MNHFYTPAVLEALGWSLIDSLWQMGLVWIAYTLITLNGTRLTAAVRHRLALAGCLLGSLSFFFFLALNCFVAREGNYIYSVAFQLKSSVIDRLTGTGAVGFNGALPFISGPYIMMVLVLSFRLLVSYRSSVRHSAAGLVSPGQAIIPLVEKLARAIIPRKQDRISVWLSEKCTSPMTLGIIKPLILLPVAAVSRLSTQQLEAVIAHEIFHIRRNDYLLNLFTAATEVLLFFNPFAILLAQAARKEMENSCDDRVLASGFDRWEYAQALYLLGQEGQEKNILALAATGTGKQLLLQRVKRIMHKRHPSPDIKKPLVLFMVSVLMTIAGGPKDKSGKTPDIKVAGNKAPALVSLPAHSLSPDGIPVMQPAVTESKATGGKPAQTKAYGDRHSSPAPSREDRDLTARSASRILTGMPEEDPAPEQPAGGVSSPVPPDREPKAPYAVIYVHAPSQTLEFTFVLPAPVVGTDEAIAGLLHPYIPSSTFYYPEMAASADSSAKKTIRL